MGVSRVLHPGSGRLRHGAPVRIGRQYSDREVIVTAGLDGRQHVRRAVRKVEVVLTTEGGEDRQLAKLKAGEFFGEMAIFEDEVRSATVRAVGEARVLEVDKKTVVKRIQDNTRLAVNMLKTMSSRLREGHTRLDGAAPSARRVSSARVPGQLVTHRRPAGGDPPPAADVPSPSRARR